MGNEIKGRHILRNRGCYHCLVIFIFLSYLLFSCCFCNNEIQINTLCTLFCGNNRLCGNPVCILVISLQRIRSFQFIFKALIQILIETFWHLSIWNLKHKRIGKLLLFVTRYFLQISWHDMKLNFHLRYHLIIEVDQRLYHYIDYNDWLFPKHAQVYKFYTRIILNLASPDLRCGTPESIVRESQANTFMAPSICPFYQRVF